jgi:hypothetical protein
MGLTQLFSRELQFAQAMIAVLGDPLEPTVLRSRQEKEAIGPY